MYLIFKGAFGIILYQVDEDGYNEAFEDLQIDNELKAKLHDPHEAALINIVNDTGDLHEPFNANPGKDMYGELVNVGKPIHLRVPPGGEPWPPRRRTS